MRVAVRIGLCLVIGALILPTLVIGETTHSSQNSVNVSNLQVEDADLRSAFLTSQDWAHQRPTQNQINSQLVNHFQAAIRVLDSRTDQGLKNAVDRIEKRFGIEFTKEEKVWAYHQLEMNRQRHIQSLKEYTARGQFPLNHGHSENTVPIFVDDQGTHCAVAYMMHRAGHDEGVSSVVESNKYVLVNQADSGPLVDWILTSGFTQEEVSVIQPAYQPPTFQASLSDFQDESYSLSMNGMTLSELSVQSHSYFDVYSADSA